MAGTAPAHTAPIPALTGQEPFFVVLNAGSGREDARAVQRTIAGVLGRAGRRHEIRVVLHPQELERTARRVVEQARRERGVVVAAGGDGTLNAVAQLVLGAGLPFGILPQGTFNYFGRAYGIPADAERAAHALLDAVVRPVQVGLLNGRAFLVNASVGLYPQLLEDREAYKQRFGRSRMVALWSGLATLLRPPRQLHLELDVEAGQTRTLRTPTLVVGNNLLQLERVGIEEAEALERSRLVAMTVRPVGTLALYGLLIRGAFSRLGEADNVSSFDFSCMRVRGPRASRPRRFKVAMDGEISWLPAPLEFKVAPHPLPLLVPRHADPADRA